MENRVIAAALSVLMFIAGPINAVAANSDMEQNLKAAFKRGELEGLHSVLVLHKGEVFSEAYFEGVDRKRGGVPLGMRQHNATSLHDLRSVTKSIVGLLYGIALSEGLVPGVQECLVCQFPEYEDLASDPKRREILIDHALSMKMGTEWNENIPYYDRRNSETAMDRAADPYRDVLDRQLVNAAGNQWIYNGGATAIIARLIAKGAGKPIDRYAREKLFEPLGITDFEWVQGFDDEPSAASGLRLNIHDLAKIGQMIVDNGEFNGRQIVPLTWLESSFTPRASTDQGLRYGYFWRLAPQRTPPTWISGNGNGGRCCFFTPDWML